MGGAIIAEQERVLSRYSKIKKQGLKEVQPTIVQVKTTVRSNRGESNPRNLLRKNLDVQIGPRRQISLGPEH